MYDFDSGKKLLLDITIAHPWAQNYIGRSCTTAGFAAAERDRIKNKKYLQMPTDLGYLFRPFSLEVFGRLGESARETLISSTGSRILTRRVSRGVAPPSVGLFTKRQCKDPVQQGQYNYRKTAVELLFAILT